MTNTMTGSMTIRMLPALPPPAQAARERTRRRRALANTLLEALATIGLGATFILCAVMILCIV